MEETSDSLIIGFDSSAGGAANPIMPDGRLISMPIPDVASPVRYGDINYKGVNFGDVARDLTRGKLGLLSSRRRVGLF